MGRALLLAGGTALGANQIYSMERLAEKHSLPAYEVVAGVSVGSVNGAMFSANKMNKLREIWEGIDGTEDFMELSVFGKAGLMSLKPLRKLLKKNVRREDISSSLELTVGVTDLQTDTYLDIPSKSFSSDSAFLDGVVASAAQPVLMEGYRLEIPNVAEKHWCFDGGVRHVIPKLPKSPQAYDAIDVVLCKPPRRLDEINQGDLHSSLQVGARAFNIMANQNVLVSDVRRLKEWSDNGARVTVYAPRHHDDEFDADHEVIMKRLNVVGKWMWENPWTPESFLTSWENS